MEENKSLSLDQLPSAVGELLTKVNTMMTRLDDIGQRIGNAPSANDHVLMDIREASAFVRKKVSSLYAYTSERRIPFYKRGNTLYFFKDQLIKWIEAGGSWDKPYESTQEEQADFEAHLAMLQKSKKDKPASMKRVKGEKNPDGEEWHDG